MSEGIQGWVERLSTAVEPAIGVMAKLAWCHVGPYPVGKHSLVWSYEEVGQGYWKTGGLWRNWMEIHACPASSKSRS